MSTGARFAIFVGELDAVKVVTRKKGTSPSDAVERCKEVMKALSVAMAAASSNASEEGKSTIVWTIESVRSN